MTDEIEASAVLDHMANAHPRMWREACEAFRTATAPESTVQDKWYWFGFWDAMLAATGYEPEVLWAKLLEKLGASRG